MRNQGPANPFPSIGWGDQRCDQFDRVFFKQVVDDPQMRIANQNFPIHRQQKAVRLWDSFQATADIRYRGDWAGGGQQLG